MKEKDTEDKAVARDKRQEKKRRRQEKLRALEQGDDEQFQVTLGGDGDEGDNEDYSKPDLDRDMEESDEGRRPAKKGRWFDKSVEADTSGVLEVEDPESLEDLEALSAKLLKRR
jgi:ATP-dependent RNA helicase DDX10/DBP4